VKVKVRVYQWHRQQILLPVPPLLISVANLPLVSTIPEANSPLVSMTPVANNGKNIRLLKIFIYMLTLLSKGVPKK
jgi:hypothetical protein